MEESGDMLPQKIVKSLTLVQYCTNIIQKFSVLLGLIRHWQIFKSSQQP